MINDTGRRWWRLFDIPQYACWTKERPSSWVLWDKGETPPGGLITYWEAGQAQIVEQETRPPADYPIEEQRDILFIGQVEE
jgi:hypothetical protein